PSRKRRSVRGASCTIPCVFISQRRLGPRDFARRRDHGDALHFGSWSSCGGGTSWDMRMHGLAILAVGFLACSPSPSATSGDDTPEHATGGTRGLGGGGGARPASGSGGAQAPGAGGSGGAGGGAA